jgi:hypothetical protein
MDFEDEHHANTPNWKVAAPISGVASKNQQRNMILLTSDMTGSCPQLNAGTLGLSVAKRHFNILMNFWALQGPATMLHPA